MDIPRWTDYKVSRIYGSVRRTCPQVTKRGRAEDVVQETLLPAWRYGDSPKEGAPVRPRIYRVATNVGFQASARLDRVLERQPCSRSENFKVDSKTRVIRATVSSWPDLVNYIRRNARPHFCSWACPDGSSVYEERRAREEQANAAFIKALGR